jgi:hypothetical protein
MKYLRVTNRLQLKRIASEYKEIIPYVLHFKKSITKAQREGNVIRKPAWNQAGTFFLLVKFEG